jgi:hypothetical protein
MYIELIGKDEVLSIDNEDDSPLPPEIEDDNFPGKLPEQCKASPQGWFFTGWFFLCLCVLQFLRKKSNCQDYMKPNGQACKHKLEKKEANIIQQRQT